MRRRQVGREGACGARTGLPRLSCAMACTVLGFLLIHHDALSEGEGDTLRCEDHCGRCSHRVLRHAGRDHAGLDQAVIGADDRPWLPPSPKLCHNSARPAQHCWPQPCHPPTSRPTHQAEQPLRRCLFHRLPPFTLPAARRACLHAVR